jgi:CDP-glucose 4,6-dehydratase
VKQSPKLNQATTTAMLRDAVADRSVLITGHTGFKGSWLSLLLAHLGAHVTGYGLAAPSEPSNFEAARVAELLSGSIEGDVRDLGVVREAIDVADPDIIFHLAAQPLVRESYRHPHATMETNFMGTCNVLEAVRLRQKPCVVVVVTSDKCYENREHLWAYREVDAMGGHDPYSASKGAVELLVASYRRSFFSSTSGGGQEIKLATARAGNVIGGGDWAADRIVPDIVAHLSAGRRVPVRNPAAIRPWQHVLEPLSGYVQLAARMLTDGDPLLCDSWNFGPLAESHVCVADLVNAFCVAWGTGGWEDKSSLHRPHEAGVLRLSIEKAMAYLQWRPVWNFGETVERTANWYRQYYSSGGKSMRKACLQDIASYLSAMESKASGQDSLRVFPASMAA